MIWQLKPIKEKEKPFTWYDVVLNFIVRAGSEQQARAIARGNASDEDGSGESKANLQDSVWMNPEVTSCVEVSVDGLDECLCRDGRWG